VSNTIMMIPHCEAHLPILKRTRHEKYRRELNY
jgi:hypothetical protein